MVKSYGWCYTITYRSMWAGNVFAGNCLCDGSEYADGKKRGWCAYEHEY